MLGNSYLKAPSKYKTTFQSVRIWFQIWIEKYQFWPNVTQSMTYEKSLIGTNVKLKQQIDVKRILQI